VGGDQLVLASPPNSAVESDDASQIELIASSLRRVYTPQEEARQDLVNLLLMLSHIPYEAQVAPAAKTQFGHKKKSIVRLLLQAAFRRRGRAQVQRPDEA
jgi:hypothetical protein